MALQLVPVGSYWMCANPLALLAVIDPVCPVELSLMIVWSPLTVSWMMTARLSPEFMKMSRVGSGVNVPAVVASSGFAGPVDLPFSVRNAKLMVSMPTLAAHAEFCVVPATGSSSRLSMFNAAHHLVGSQEAVPTATCHVGH